MTAVTPKVSILITTYNPHPGRLERTLAGLLNQTLRTTEWELVFVDNASQSVLSARAIGLDRFANWRLVREERRGVVFGRATAVLQSHAPTIVFVDDDNVLDSRYLDRTIQIFNRYPNLGVGGGKSIPEWEGQEPEPWVVNFYEALALRNLGEGEILARKTKCYECPEYRPICAGMIIRREAIIGWADETHARGSLLGRIGQERISGEDDDIVMCCFNKHWEVGYFPELALTHIIPIERVTRAYLGRLVHSIAKSEVIWTTMHGVKTYPKAKRWTVPLRKLRAYWRFHAWSGPIEYVWWKGACGQFEGRALVSQRRC